jgi:hypothetical protein
MCNVIDGQLGSREMQCDAFAMIYGRRSRKKKTEEQGENGNEVRFLSEKFVLNDGVLVCYACRRERM